MPVKDGDIVLTRKKGLFCWFCIFTWMILSAFSCEWLTPYVPTQYAIFIATFSMVMGFGTIPFIFFCHERYICEKKDG